MGSLLFRLVIDPPSSMYALKACSRRPGHNACPYSVVRRLFMSTRGAFFRAILLVNIIKIHPLVVPKKPSIHLTHSASTYLLVLLYLRSSHTHKHTIVLTTVLTIAANSVKLYKRAKRHFRPDPTIPAAPIMILPQALNDTSTPLP